VIAAIMQPYFFPYIGYFQLMKAVDIFVLYDDAQYMKGGWINRNRILVNHAPAWLTLPVHNASLKLPISQRNYCLNPEAIAAIKVRLQMCYQKAPAFDFVYPFLCGLFDYSNSNVAAFNANLLIEIARRFGLTCKFLTTSSMDTRADLKGQAKVIHICREIGADRYINPIGGLPLYDEASFSDEGIQLQFLQAKPDDYPQFGAVPVPFLSIIDVLMFNSVEKTQEMLNNYRLFVPEKAPMR